MTGVRSKAVDTVQNVHQPPMRTYGTYRIDGLCRCEPVTTRRERSSREVRPPNDRRRYYPTQLASPAGSHPAARTCDRRHLWIKSESSGVVWCGRDDDGDPPPTPAPNHGPRPYCVPLIRP